MESKPAPVILLAGGKSSRMGQPKGLVPFEGRPWIETQLSRLAACGLREVIVVLGYQAEVYNENLPWLASTRSSTGAEVQGARVRSVVNPLPEFGPFSSIQAGGRLALEAESVWILPIDVPCPNPPVWARLSASTAAVCVPLHDGRGGHPVKISKDFLEHLLKQPADGPDSRLDHQIRQLGPKAERLEVDDPTILKNLNSPGDWA